MFLRRLDEEELALPEHRGSARHGVARRTDSSTPEAITPRSSGCSATPDTEGYALPGTVIETNTDDSPFLVDSVARGAERARRASTRCCTRWSAPIASRTGGSSGSWRAVRPRTASRVMHFEVDRRLAGRTRADLEGRVAEILGDVRLVVRDFEPMRSACAHMAELARQGAVRVLAAGGRRDDRLHRVAARPETSCCSATASTTWWTRREGRALQAAAGTRGSASCPKVERARSRDADAAELARARTAAPDRGRRPARSTRRRTAPHRAPPRADGLHRGAHGGRRRARWSARRGSLGLFTSKAYMEPASKTPLLTHKLEQIIAAEDLIAGSHDYKAGGRALRVVPEGRAVPRPRPRSCAGWSRGCSSCRSRRASASWCAEDLYGRSVSVVVALPRERFNA